jgi:L-fuconate dehydratase
VRDVRFPTSDFQDGSDAVHKDPDYSCVYVILHTSAVNASMAPLEGHGFTFTLGRGNEVIALCVKAFLPQLVGKTLGGIVADMVGFVTSLTCDGQLRWLGPEKGVVHMASGAIINAVWDMWAKYEAKPLWKLLVDMSPEQLVSCIDFHWIVDALTPEEAVAILKGNAAGDAKAKREAEMRADGFPAYTTSAGWLGYPDDKIRRLCRQYLGEGMNHFKIKVGGDQADDLRRAAVVREEIGPDRKLMMDANQKWSVDEAIVNMKELAKFEPWWIEEPTNPDDILGHAKIAKALKPLGVGVATGEVCHNAVMFKQLLQADAISFCQIDTCRVAGINELLAILLMAKKFGVPVCPHAGGVGLCEYVRHIVMFDYISIGASLENRICESTSHLHEHFHDPWTLKRGNYMPPTVPGYGTMKRSSILDFEFPDGPVHTARRAKQSKL